MTKRYDSKAGIAAALSSLAELNELLAERRAAAYGDGERLGKYLILGRFLLDTCGNLGKATRFIPKEHFPTIPDVLTFEEWEAYFVEHAEDPEGVWMGFEMTDQIPDAELCCSECGCGWTLANCHDMIVYAGEDGANYHGACNQARMLREFAANFREVLELAGFSGFRMIAIPNGYACNEYASPWFEVTLSDCQRIVIGWREWGITIDYTNTSFDGSIACGDDVENQPGSYCHARGYDDAARYLTTLRDNIAEEEPAYAC